MRNGKSQARVKNTSTTDEFSMTPAITLSVLPIIQPRSIQSAQSQHGHSTVTARSQHGHSTVTARSQHGQRPHTLSMFPIIQSRSIQHLYLHMQWVGPNFGHSHRGKCSRH